MNDVRISFKSNQDSKPKSFQIKNKKKALNGAGSVQLRSINVNNKIPTV